MESENQEGELSEGRGGMTDGTCYDNLVNEEDSEEGEHRRVRECEGGE